MAGRRACHKTAVIAPIEADPGASLARNLILNVGGLVEVLVMIDAEGQPRLQHVGEFGSQQCNLPIATRRDSHFHISTSARWTRWIEIEPSPTADATRFTLPERISPTAKTAGRLVSSICGGRLSGHFSGALSRAGSKSRPVR